MNNDDILTYENAEISHYFECNKGSFERKSADTSVNVYGYQMLDFCKSNVLFILNGRFGEDKNLQNLRAIISYENQRLRKLQNKVKLVEQREKGNFQWKPESVIYCWYWC